MPQEAQVPESAPKWVAEEVVRSVEGPVRSVQMLRGSTAIVFTDAAAIVAEKSRLGGVKVFRADYPKGFLLNGSNCPHCGEPITEPVARIARLAGPEKKARQRGRNDKAE